MALVIATCTNRKRKPVADEHRASALPKTNLSEAADIWCDRLAARGPKFPASDLYCGRAFQESAVAAQSLRAKLLIVSAGLGLVEASTEIPSYACTVLLGVEDSIAARITDTFVSSSWWTKLIASSPFSSRLCQTIHESEGRVYAALSGAYIEMISGDILELSEIDRSRIRIFTRSSLDHLPFDLRSLVMPYDDRLDGPDSVIRGTRSDFASRALRHFAEHVVIPGDVNDLRADCAAVEDALNGWRTPVKFERKRLDSAEIKRLIDEHWEVANGSSARLLRLLRDELNVACEQSRFASLVREVKDARS